MDYREEITPKISKQPISIFLTNNTETGIYKQKRKQNPSTGQELFRCIEGKSWDGISNAVFKEGGIHICFELEKQLQWFGHVK
jgi:hypothetical protein